MGSRLLAWLVEAAAGPTAAHAFFVGAFQRYVCYAIIHPPGLLLAHSLVINSYAQSPIQHDTHTQRPGRASVDQSIKRPDAATARIGAAACCMDIFRSLLAPPDAREAPKGTTRCSGPPTPHSSRRRDRQCQRHSSSKRRSRTTITNAPCACWTSATARPLYVRAPSVPRSASIAEFEPQPCFHPTTAQLFPCLRHRCHRTCTVDYADDCVRNNNPIPIPCPIPGCDAHLTDAQVRWNSGFWL
jgi:hypothetical protein